MKNSLSSKEKQPGLIYSRPCFVQMISHLKKTRSRIVHFCSINQFDLYQADELTKSLSEEWIPATYLRKDAKTSEYKPLSKTSEYKPF